MNNFDDLFVNQANEKPTGKEFTSFNKEEWAAQKQQERADAYTLIDSTAEQMVQDGGLFQRYLDVQARFDRYSVGDSLLITAQMPDANRLADFKGWKDADIYVKKGATGITILEPGDEYTREDGTTGVSYNAKKVFDISQTTSRVKTSPSVSHDPRVLLKALINNAPCKIVISEELPADVGAVYKPEDKSILVRQGMDAPDIFRALSQELAHAHMDKGEYSRADCAFDAYCVSYVLCKRNNIAVDTFRFDRLPDSLKEMDAQGIRGELGHIRDVANEVSADMNRVLEAQQRSQKSRDDGAEQEEQYE